MKIERLNTSNDNTVSSLTSIPASYTSIADEYDRFKHWYRVILRKCYKPNHVNYVIAR